MGNLIPLSKTVDRRGDSTITTLKREQHELADPPRGETLEVYIHDDGGVTLLQRNHRGDELGRVSMLMEEADELLRLLTKRSG